MGNIALQSTKWTASIIERLLKSHLTVDGLDRLPDGPLLFVPNHFTRAEAFLGPYVIEKHAGIYPRTLAHASLFHGLLGEYFRHMDVFSTRDPDRDQLIIRDLLTGDHAWLIYPEGSMVKSKKLVKRGKLHLTLPEHVGPPHTGAATLALKAELYRRQLLDALSANDVRRVSSLLERLKLEAPDQIDPSPLHIVPVTISYYPLRPGQNLLKRLARKYFRDLPQRMDEELEIEGNLLLRETDINFHFGEPVTVGEFLGRFRTINRLLPFWKSLDVPNVLLMHCAKRLTGHLMEQVYTHVLVNFDHLYCTALRERRGGSIPDVDLRRALYLAAHDLRDKTEFRLHPALDGQLTRWLAGVACPGAGSIRRLAEEKGIVTARDGQLTVHKLKLDMQHMFHQVRVQNPFMVIANEVEPLPRLSRLVTLHVNSESDDLVKQTRHHLLAEDLHLYTEERDRHVGERMLADDVSRPFLLSASGSRTGVVLSHGFLASPGEVRGLGEYLHGLGLNVYGVRLPGHGVSPSGLANARWEDWFEAYVRGMAILRTSCDRIICGGFSTGGLLALLAAIEARLPVTAAFAINPPASLSHIRARLVPAVHFWNELLTRFHVPVGRLQWVDTEPEYPDTNYNRIFLDGLVALDGLMHHVRSRMDEIKAPVWIGVGEDDPTVSPESGRRLHRHLTNPDSRLEDLPFDRHVIVRGEGAEWTYRAVHQFLYPMLELPPVPVMLPPSLGLSSLPGLRSRKGVSPVRPPPVRKP